MTLRKTGIVVLVFLALGAFYYFYVLKAEERKKKAEEAEKKILWQVKIADVEEFSVTRAGQEVLIKKNGEAYQVISPVEAKADKRTAEAVLTALINAEKVRTVSEEAKDLAPFGLDQPALSLAVKLKGGAKRELSLGSLTITGDDVYGRLLGKKGVFLLAKSTWESVNRTMFDLRDRTVLAFEEMKVDRLEVTRDGQTLAVDVIDKGPPQRFRVKLPLDTEGDFDDIRDLLDLLKNLQARGYGEYQPKSLSSYGLDKPDITVKIWAEGIKKSPLVLFLGKEHDKNQFYAGLEPVNEVIYVDKKFVQGLPKSAYDLREKKVLIMDVDAVKKASLFFDSKEIVIERRGEKKWEIMKPVTTPGSDSRITSWLADIRNLKARQFLDEPPANLKPFGLDEPQAKVTIWLEKEKEPLTLIKGAQVQDALFVKAEGKKLVALVDARAASIFQQDPFNLKDRRFFPYELDQVGEITIQKGLFKAIMKKDKDTWKLREPKDAELDAMRAWNIYWQLREIEYQQEIADKTKQLSRYGLDKPAALVELKGIDGKKLDLLRIGNLTETGKQRYAALDSRPQAFLMNTDDFKKLPGSWEDLY